MYLHGYECVEKSHKENLWKAISEIVLAKPILVEQKELPVSCSVGMSIYGRDTRDIYDLIEYADFAMYELRKTARKATAASKWRDTGTRKLLFCK
ncbi:diguanylate cyclase domain-containing protein [Proteiniclasticum ruminis]|uniref:diguanylate cyclase domain-containing protein n=1 Tax=Proteiniclasticum ruminis TaxID=398199 RepID=UPI0028A97F89|nr:diguanylate cyclase [Proteiniclasticum ruminis]